MSRSAKPTENESVEWTKIERCFFICGETRTFSFVTLLRSKFFGSESRHERTCKCMHKHLRFPELFMHNCLCVATFFLDKAVVSGNERTENANAVPTSFICAVNWFRSKGSGDFFIIHQLLLYASSQALLANRRTVHLASKIARYWANELNALSLLNACMTTPPVGQSWKKLSNKEKRDVLSCEHIARRLFNTFWWKIGVYRKNISKISIILYSYGVLCARKRRLKCSRVEWTSRWLRKRADSKQLSSQGVVLVACGDAWCASTAYIFELSHFIYDFEAKRTEVKKIYKWSEA